MARKPVLIPTISLLATGIAGCTGGSSPTPLPTPAPAPRGPAPLVVSADPWVLSTDRWDPQSRGAYLGNGLLGQRFMQSGIGLSGTTSEPAYQAGLYERESIVTLPSLLPLRIEAGGKAFGADPAAVKKYHQELRMRDGVLLTRATWDAGTGPVELELRAALLRQAPGTAVLDVHADNHGTAPVRFSLPLAAGGAVTRTPGVLSVACPAHGTSWRMTLRSPGSPAVAVPDAAALDLPAGRTADLELVTETRRPGVSAPAPSGETGSRPELAAHRAEWSDLWSSDIEIEGDPEAQQVVRSCLFYLLSSVRPENAAGVPPMGLSSNAFSGHVFWDMDSWMLPAVLPLHPELARAMLEYRYRTLPGAKANAQAEGQPGASYAWESGSTGKETLSADAVFRHGRHVSGDVALAMRQYYLATGDRDWLRSRAWPVLQATADNWVARAQPDGKGGFIIRKVTTPDENAGLVDGSAWTHAVARTNLLFAAETARALGLPANPKWELTAKGLGYLRDPKTGLILSYEGFKENTKAKQADALLLAFPAEEKIPEAELGKMYDFYQPRVIANGPAMTDAIHALVAARLGRGEEALHRFQDSYRPFLRSPFQLFSEKRTRDNVCFLTGASGVVEAVLYGFAGIRLDGEGTGGHPRSEPHLPPGWKSLRVRCLHWRGKAWDVEVRPGAPPKWTLCVKSSSRSPAASR